MQQVDSTEEKPKQTQVEITSHEPVVEVKEKVSVEEFKINGEFLVSTIKDLVHKGNIRRIIIKNEKGQALIEIPLTVGVVGGVISAALFPMIAAVCAIGAVVARLTLVIEKRQ